MRVRKIKKYLIILVFILGFSIIGNSQEYDDITSTYVAKTFQGGFINSKGNITSTEKIDVSNQNIKITFSGHLITINSYAPQLYKIYQQLSNYQDPLGFTNCEFYAFDKNNKQVKINLCFDDKNIILTIDMFDSYIIYTIKR